MSTVVVGTIQSNSTSPPTFNNTNGTEIGTLCRAFVNFNGTTNTGGFCTIRASFNVTSVADAGVGLYTVNLTNAMPDSNYAPVTSPYDWSAVSRNVSTTAITISTFTSTSGAARDDTEVKVAVFR
jgi:hypothetical protein